MKARSRFDNEANKTTSVVMDISANAQHRIAAARRACHASKGAWAAACSSRKSPACFPISAAAAAVPSTSTSPLLTSSAKSSLEKTAPDNLDLSQNIAQAKLYSPPYPLFQNKNIMHNTCPKCSAAIAGGSKTCGSCGSVRPDALFYLLRVKTMQSLTMMCYRSAPTEQSIVWAQA